MKWLKRLFEDANGVPDEARVMSVLLVLGFVASGLWDLANGSAFNPKDWGIGAGALAAGIGGWMGLRKDN